MKRTIFTLASARSGTLFLRDLFRLNAVDCVSRHEPFFDWGNPTMFGPAVYDAYAGRVERLRARLIKKRNYIERLPGAIYLESSHAFLKSAYLAAWEVFPDLRLVHLIRDPLKVAKSEAYRHQWRQRLRVPFHFYRGDDGRRHFYWALTGNEEIFGHFARTPLTLFQWYLVQWIEIENRALDFLDRRQLHDRCFTLQSPADLNVPEKVRAMFDFLGLATRQPGVLMGRPRNKSLGPKTAVSPEDERQSEAVLAQLPARYLEIFQREPYSRYHWSRRFQQRLSLEARAAH
jgi:hypothetical protein